MSQVVKTAMAVALWWVASPLQAQATDATPAALVPEPHETPRPHPPLFFREDWKVTPGIPLMHAVLPSDVGDPALELKLYGPSAASIYKNGAPDQPTNPPHLWTGFCEQTCAAALRDTNYYVDLSGWAKIRWLTRQSGLNQIHVILKLADGTWLVSEHGDAVGLDHHISEFTFSETRWIGLDINRVVTRGVFLDKVDLTKVDEIGFTTLMPGSGQGYGGYADVGWIEVYGNPVPRPGSVAEKVSLVGAQPMDAQTRRLYGQFADKTVTELAHDQQARAAGKTLFASECASCHGLEGHGMSGIPALTNTELQWGRTAESITATITNGIAANMPAWLEVLGSAGVEDVLAHTLAFSGRTASAGDATRGKELYATTCASCHGYDGKGNARIGAPNLTDSIWLYGAGDAAIRKSIADGRKGAMPAQGERLGVIRVNLLAAYVLTLNASTQEH